MGGSQLISGSGCCLSRRDPLRLLISLPCVTLSFESLKLLHIYLLLLIIRSGLIYWHDAHIYLFITFTRMIRGLFISRTERQELAWELELSFCQMNWLFFCHGFFGSTAASEAHVFGGQTVDTADRRMEAKGSNWLTEAWLTVSWPTISNPPAAHYFFLND